MDWIANRVMPPNKPSGLRLFGYNVTWLDLSLVGYPLAGAIALYLWSGEWLWFPAVALCMGLAILIWGLR